MVFSRNNAGCFTKQIAEQKIVSFVVDFSSLGVMFNDTLVYVLLGKCMYV